VTNPLADLARRVSRLTIDRRDPEKFHCDKSEIAHDLRRLARTLPASGADRTTLPSQKDTDMAFHPTFKRTVRIAVDEAVAATRDFDQAVQAVSAVCGPPPDDFKLPAAVYRWGLGELGVDIPRDLAPSGFEALFQQHAANAKAGRIPNTIAADSKVRASLAARFGANVGRLKSGAI
jgi:hypothetical protein